MKYCYVVTCENLDGSNVKISGDCYHEFENAVAFVTKRSDNPQCEELQPMIYKSEERIYKIIPLTFGDKPNI